MQEEIWRPIKGYEGIYDVSNLGRVRSHDKHTKHNYGGLKLQKGRILNPKKGTNGYVRVYLSDKNSKTKRFSIHRIVGNAFVENPQGKPQINHINSDRSDNRASNLEWVTNSENQKHAYKNGKQKPRKGKDNVLSIGVSVFNKGGTLIKSYESISDAAKDLKCCRKAISNCCKGAKDNIKGMKFEFNN